MHFDVYVAFYDKHRNIIRKWCDTPTSPMTRKPHTELELFNEEKVL